MKTNGILDSKQVNSDTVDHPLGPSTTEKSYSGVPRRPRTRSVSERGCWLSSHDHDRLKTFVQEFVVRAVIPWAERLIKAYNELVCVFIFIILYYCVIYYYIILYYCVMYYYIILYYCVMYYYIILYYYHIILLCYVLLYHIILLYYYCSTSPRSELVVSLSLYSTEGNRLSLNLFQGEPYDVNIQSQ